MTQFPTRTTLVGALMGAALVVPSTAGAAVTTNVAGTTLTVTSDQDADTIAVGASGGFITVNGQATTLLADRNAKLVIDAGDGADTVDATALAAANYATLTVDG